MRKSLALRTQKKNFLFVVSLITQWNSKEKFDIYEQKLQNFRKSLSMEIGLTETIETQQ